MYCELVIQKCRFRLNLMSKYQSQNLVKVVYDRTKIDPKNYVEANYILKHLLPLPHCPFVYPNQNLVELI